MKTVYRLSTTVKLKRMARVFFCLSLALLVALGGLSIYTIGVVSERREMEEALSRKSVELSRMEQDAAAKQNQWEEQLSAVQGQLDDATTEKSQLNDAVQSQSQEISKLLDGKTTKTTASQATETKPTVSKTTATKPTNKTTVKKPTGKKMVALTFDDGPGRYTEKLLDALKERNAKATFFVLGQLVDRYPDLIKRMDAEGHVVGSHSYDHPNLTKLTYAQIKSNMDKTAKKINKLIGHDPEVIRCPGGSSNDTVKKYAKNAGVPIIYWDVDTLDWKSRNTKKILEEAFDAETGIEDGDIVLMHDIYDTTVDAAIEMMDRLIAEGYTLVTVPELLEAYEGTIVAGKVY